MIGGSETPAPVLLLELWNKGEHIDIKRRQQTVLEGIKPLLANIREENALKLAPELTIFATKNKPFVTTIKFNVARRSTLKLYENEIKALFG